MKDILKNDERTGAKLTAPKTAKQLKTSKIAKNSDY